MPSTRLRTQLDFDDAALLAAIDDVAETMTAAAERSATRGLARFDDRRRRSWKKPLIAAAAAFVTVLVVVALSALLFADREPVDPATTITTVAPPTTQALPLDAFTWSKIEGTRETLPAWWLQPDGASGYISYEGTLGGPSGRVAPTLWQSADATDWVSSDIVELSEFDWVMFGWPDQSLALDWALGGGTRLTLAERTGETWLPVELSEPLRPAISGLVWEAEPTFPVQSGGVTLVVATGHGRVPWENYFGTREVFGREVPNFPEFDDESQTLRFLDSEERLLSELTVGVDGDTIVFTDLGTGDVVHEVTTTVDHPPETVLDNGFRVQFFGVWLATDGGSFEFHPAPWTGSMLKPPLVVALPTGGFAAFVLPEEDGVVGRTQLWTSSDGVTWVDQGLPAFLTDVDGVEDVFVRPWIDGLRAEVLTSDGFEAWESADGLDWTPQALFPPETRVFGTTFGYVAVSSSHLDTETFEFWVSTDGEVWEPLEAPPGSHTPDGGGYGRAGAAGDVIYLSVGEDDGSRFIWIGRFET